MPYHPKKNEAFHSVLFFLRLHMYYPNAIPEKKILSFLKWVVIRTLTIFNFIGIGAHFTISLQNGSYPVIIGDLALGLGYFSIFIGHLLFRRNHERWGQFLSNLTDFKKFEKPENYDTMVKRLNLFSTVGSFYALVGTYLYVRLPIVNHNPCQKMNELHGLNEICGLPYPFWWPNELTSSQKRIVSVLQTISLALSSMPAMQLILLPVTIVEILKTRVEHFGRVLRKVFDNTTNDENEVKKELGFCIEYHQYLIDLGRIFNYLYFLNFAHVTSAGSIVIALILTQLLQVYNIGNVAHVSAWICGLFLVCRAGQMLEDMFTDISDVAYFTKWYQTTLSNTKTILILMMRTRKPIFLESMPCGKHNFELFVALAKTTYSYLTLMTQYK